MFKGKRFIEFSSLCQCSPGCISFWFEIYCYIINLCKSHNYINIYIVNVPWFSQNSGWFNSHFFMDIPDAAPVRRRPLEVRRSLRRRRSFGRASFFKRQQKWQGKWWVYWAKMWFTLWKRFTVCDLGNHHDCLLGKWTSIYTWMINGW